jgi:hypothetical protein
MHRGLGGADMQGGADSGGANIQGERGGADLQEEREGADIEISQGERGGGGADMQGGASAKMGLRFFPGEDFDFLDESGGGVTGGGGEGGVSKEDRAASRDARELNNEASREDAMLDSAFSREPSREFMLSLQTSVQASPFSSPTLPQRSQQPISAVDFSSRYKRVTAATAANISESFF